MEFLLSNFNNIGNALGWTLIHFLWQGSLLFLFYWVITRLFLSQRIKTQYWVGMLFILMCLVVPLREFSIQLEATSQYSNAIIHQIIGSSINPIESAGILSPFDMFVTLIQKFIPYLVIFWMSSVILISSHLIKSWLYLVKLGKDSSLKLPEYLANKMQLACERLQLRFKPIISISEKIDVPATFGYFKPVILLPTSIIAKLPQDQMEAILLHELCHIKRADFLHNILQLLVETLFFYHPLTKWISRDIRKIREQCCDELVLELNNNPLIYAKALTNIASIYNNIQSKNATSHIQIAATDGELYKRIKFLMLEKRSKPQFANLFLGLFLAFFSLLAFNSIIKNNSNGQFKSTKFATINSPISIKKGDRPNYLIPDVAGLINQPHIKNNQASIVIEKLPLVKNNESTSFSVEPKIIRDKSKITKKEQGEAQAITNIIDEIDSQSSILQNSVTNISNETTTKLVEPKGNLFPRLTYKVNPSYSRAARSRGIEGTVILSFNINEKGRVKKIIVDKSSPLKLLDGSARQALHKWRFDPKSINEHSLKNRYQQIFSFNLNGTDQCIKGNVASRLSSNPVCQEL